MTYQVFFSRLSSLDPVTPYGLRSATVAECQAHLAQRLPPDRPAVIVGLNQGQRVVVAQAVEDGRYTVAAWPHPPLRRRGLVKPAKLWELLALLSDPDYTRAFVNPWLDINENWDRLTSEGTNLAHIQHVFEGYRACILGQEFYSPYSPGSAREMSWSYGYNKGLVDQALSGA